MLEQTIREKAEEALRDATIDDVVTRCTTEDFKVKMFGRLMVCLYLGQYATITRLSRTKNGALIESTYMLLLRISRMGLIGAERLVGTLPDAVS